MNTFEDQLYASYLNKAQAEAALLAKNLAGCKSCSLRQNELAPVSGTGPPTADIFLLKGSPTEEEAKKGLAFSGAAAEAIIKAFKKLDLDVLFVYGTNALKCLPADGQKKISEATDKNSKELENCYHHLKMELAIAQPKIIVIFGSLALKAYRLSLGDGARGFSLERGAATNSPDGMKIILTHDIARALEAPELKKKLWADLKLLQKTHS